MSIQNIIIWSVAFTAFLFYVERLTLEQPKGRRLLLRTYWFVSGALFLLAGCEGVKADVSGHTMIGR